VGKICRASGDGETNVSIASIMSTGLSALAANQQAMKATSTNVANVNTKGYSRLDVQFVSKQAQGGLHGVEIEITRVANAYLAAAEMRGAADVAAADILSQFMDRAQGLLGDPSDSSTVFAALDPVFSSFGSLAVDPGSALRRSAVLSDLQTMLSQMDTTAGEIAALRDEAHSRAVAAMEEANSLMSGIARLNTSIQRSTISGLQASEAETEQQRMIDRLSEIIDIRTQQRPLGGVEIRTTDGLLLVDLDAATFGLDSTSDGEAYPGTVMIPPRSTTETPLETHIGGGELKGLIRARDKELVNLQLSFGEFAAGAAEALNAAHNQATAVPAPGTLTGRNTGLIGTDLLNFTGRTNIAVTNPAGEVVKNFRIDFGAGTITDEAGVSTAFANSVGDLTTQLNTRLGADGTVTFVNGVMTLSADTAGNGVVITDDPTTPATRAGRGFSHTFGLNDLITKGKPLTYATGLSGADLHGFTTGQTLKFALRDTDGAIVRSIDFTVTAGVTTIAQLRTAIDTALTGYGQTTFDATGRMTLQPTNNSVGRIDVLQDTTTRGGTSLSLSEIFGLGETLPAQRAINLQVNSAIRANPNLLGSAQADLFVDGATVLAGVRVLSPGDGRGALAVEAAGTTPRPFADAGSLTGQVTSITDYAAEALEAARDAAESVREEVKQRRMSEEGVNLDEELVKMTTYQQAYAAASRMITAARDLYDVILNMV
jgi:flagellar hook-associated protein 1 FlgK